MYVQQAFSSSGPALRDHITVDGLRIAVEDSGAVEDSDRGDPVILLHSSGGSAGQWRALRALLEPRHRVLAPDLIGYGRSSAWHGRRAPRIDDEVEIVAALLDRCQRPARLIGHSWGGVVALQAALNMPERVVDLTLIEPVAFALLADGGLADARLLAEVHLLAGEIAAALADGEPDIAMARFVDYWNGPGAWAALSPQRQADLAGRGARVVDNFRALFRQPVPPNALYQLHTPTLLIGGARSPAPTRRIVERLGNALPLVRTRLIAGAGHMAPLTHAEAVNAAILSFLRPAGRARHAVEALALAA